MSDHGEHLIYILSNQGNFSNGTKVLLSQRLIIYYNEYYEVNQVKYTFNN